MSIPMNSLCVQCHLGRTLDTARPLGDDEKLTRLTKGLLRLYLELPEGSSSPALGPATSKLLQELYGLDPDRFRLEKEQSNRFVMERLETIRSRIDAAPDPLYAALQFSVLGNYLDFAALQGKVRFEELEQLLDSALEMDLDRAAYGHFLEDLARGKRLLILTDNAGEIAFDRLLAQCIRQRYGQLEITFCVRGGPTHNDATRADAKAVELEFSVIDNGNTVGGTELSLLSEQARRTFEEADLILAKGMGNTETLAGCGYNVYYGFLVKCQRFVQYFEKPMMTPLFIRERDIKK